MSQLDFNTSVALGVTTLLFEDSGTSSSLFLPRNSDSSRRSRRYVCFTHESVDISSIIARSWGSFINQDTYPKYSQIIQISWFVGSLDSVFSWKIFTGNHEFFPHELRWRNPRASVQRRRRLLGSHLGCGS